jgi:hypothetical protein
VNDHKEATDKSTILIKTQAAKPPTEGVAGCNHVYVNLFWIVYQYNNSFIYKSFLDLMICADSLPRLADVL